MSSSRTTQSAPIEAGPASNVTSLIRGPDLDGTIDTIMKVTWNIVIESRAKWWRASETCLALFAETLSLYADISYEGGGFAAAHGDTAYDDINSVKLLDLVIERVDDEAIKVAQAIYQDYPMDLVPMEENCALMVELSRIASELRGKRRELQRLHG